MFNQAVQGHRQCELQCELIATGAAAASCGCCRALCCRGSQAAPAQARHAPAQVQTPVTSAHECMEGRRSQGRRATSAGGLHEGVRGRVARALRVPHVKAVAVGIFLPPCRHKPPVVELGAVARRPAGTDRGCEAISGPQVHGAAVAVSSGHGKLKGTAQGQAGRQAAQQQWRQLSMMSIREFPGSCQPGACQQPRLARRLRLPRSPPTRPPSCAQSWRGQSGSRSGSAQHEVRRGEGRGGREG